MRCPERPRHCQPAWTVSARRTRPLAQVAVDGEKRGPGQPGRRQGAVLGAELELPRLGSTVDVEGPARLGVKPQVPARIVGRAQMSTSREKLILSIQGCERIRLIGPETGALSGLEPAALRRGGLRIARRRWNKPWEFQFGAELQALAPTGPTGGAPFLAVNGHLRKVGGAR